MDLGGRWRAVAATDERPGEAVLWQGEDGEALAEQVAALMRAFADLLETRHNT